MAMLIRKRNRKVRLNNRLGSRRNRILISLALIAISFASWLVSSGKDQNQVSYFSAVTDMARNTKLNTVTLNTVTLNLSEEANLYLPASKDISAWYLIAPVRAGELIPVSAIAPTRLERCVGVKLNLGNALSPTIHKGSWLDLWAGDSNNPPTQIVAAGELLSLANNTDALSQNVQQIEVCIANSEIGPVVAAIAQHKTIVGVRSL